MTSAMSSFRKSKPSVGPYWRDSARFSLDISAFMRSKRSCGKLSVAGRPPARDITSGPVSYTHLRAHETKANLVCRLLLEKKKKTIKKKTMGLNKTPVKYTHIRTNEK